MTEGYDLISQLLQATYSSNNDSIRKSAEDQLALYSKSHSQMIQALLQIVSVGPDNNLRQSAATRLSQLVRNLLEASVLTAVEKCSISEQIFSAMVLPVSRTVKEQMASILTSLISDSNSGIVATKLSILCTQNLKSNFDAVQGSLLCVRSLFNLISNDFSTKEYFDKLLPALTQVGSSALAVCYQSLSGPTSGTEAAAILYTWTDCFSQILEHFEMVSPKTLKLFLRQVPIAELFYNILNMKFHGQGVAVFGTTAETKELTKSKTAVLKCLNIVIQYIIDSKKKLIEEQEGLKNLTTLAGMDLPDSPFVSITWNIIGGLVEELISLGKEIILSNISEDFQKDYLIESLQLFHKCCAESRFFNVFSKYYKEIINYLIINSLRYADDEKDLHARDPQEFVDMGMDICERQDSETVKTMSAKLLEAICDSIDGALTYVVSLVSENFYLVFETRSQNMSDPRVFSFSLEEEEKIDYSIILLSTLNYSISKRKDLVTVQDNFLARYQQILTNSRSAIIQSRTGLLLYFFLEHIHQDSAEHFFLWVNFIVDCMTHLNPFMAGIIQACETFTAITQDEETMLRINDHIEKIFVKLTAAVPFQKQKNFFESLGDFINWFAGISHEQVLCLLRNLVDKILVEINQDKIIASKCWSVVRGILGLNFLEVDKMAIYEQVVSPVFKLLKFPEKLSFEDDIITAVQNAMKKTQKISDIQWEILSILPLFQMKQEDSLQGLLKLISSFILYGKAHIQENTLIITTFTHMALKALYSKKSGEIREISCSEGAILLQILLTSFPGYLDTALPEILKQCLIRYSSPPVTSTFFRTRLLQVFLASFSYNFQMASSLLQSAQTESQVSCFRFIVLEIIKNFIHFKQEYDKKISMIGFSHLLVNLNLNPEIQELAGHVFEILVMILSQKPVYENMKSSKLTSLIDKLMTDNIDSLCDSEIIVKGSRYLMNESTGMSSEESEALITLTHVMTVFSDYDEYSAFKTTLNHLNQNHPDWVRHRISSLSETRKRELIEVISSQKVKLSAPGNNSAVRKIVKPKRNRN